MKDITKNSNRPGRKRKSDEPDKPELHFNSHVVPEKEPLKTGSLRKKNEYLFDRKLHPLLIESMIQNGLNYSQICEKLGVPVSVFVYWRRTHPEVKEAIRRGKLPMDDKVEQSLFRTATGYTYEEVTLEPKTLSIKEIEARKNLPDPPPIPLVKKKVVRKQVAPNVLAQIFYLKNKKPEIWKDRSNVSVGGKIEYEVTLPPRPEDIRKAGELKIGDIKVEMIEDKTKEAIKTEVPDYNKKEDKEKKKKKVVIDKDVNLQALINNELNLDEIKDGMFG